MDTIFTLNARDNFFLDVISKRFNIAQPQMRVEIQTMFRNMRQDLEKSGLHYVDLKTALVPSLDNHEAGFIFDSTAIESSIYGAEVMSRILPLLDSRSTHSCLVGDLIASNDAQEFIFSLLEQFLVGNQPFEYVDSTLLFCVYLNNLTKKSLARIHEGLQRFTAYLGYIPCTYSSLAKTYLSTSLMNLFIKREQVILLAHEDDRSNDENINITLSPFEKSGYSIRSIQEHEFNHFLSYKIERALFPGFESDTHFSLNAITDHVSPLAGMDVLIEDAKFEYLIKANKLVKGGLTHIGKFELATMIRSRIEANYIYNLRYMKEHNVMSFNVIIEVEHPAGGYPARMNVSLEYLPDNHLLRVITLF